MPNKNHGGKRQGAGRKPSGAAPKVNRSINFDADVAEYLKTNPNPSQLVNALVKRSKVFREFTAQGGKVASPIAQQLPPYQQKGLQ